MKKPIHSFVIMTAAILISVGSSILLTHSSPPKSSSAPPRTRALRIVSGYTAFTDILRALNAEKSIVAATRSDAEKLNVPSIGSHMRPDPEAIAAANPDLILISSQRPALLESLRQKLPTQNMQILAAHPSTIEKTLQLIEQLGNITGHEREAAELIGSARAALERTARSLKEQNKKPKSVFIEVRNHPALLSSGQDSIATDILRLAGGKNICNLSGSVVPFNIEAVVAANPNFYIQQVGAMNKTPLPVNEHAVIRRLNCIRDGRFRSIEEARLSRPGPHSAAMVEQLHNWLYPKEQTHE